MESDDMCNFKPLKKDQLPCDRKVTTPYGFCTPHSKSLQGVKAKEQYEAAQSSKKEKDISKSDDAESDSASDDERPQKKNVPVEKKKVEVLIARDKFGRFVHEKTGLVFNPKTRKAFGYVTGPKKDIFMHLDDEHIKLCEKYGFDYAPPEDTGNHTESDSERETDDETVGSDDESEDEDEEEEDEDGSDEEDEEDEDERHGDGEDGSDDEGDDDDDDDEYASDDDDGSDDEDEDDGDYSD